MVEKRDNQKNTRCGNGFKEEKGLKKCVRGLNVCFYTQQSGPANCWELSAALQWCVEEGCFLTETRKERLKELAQSERKVLDILSTVDNRFQPLHHTVGAMSGPFSSAFLSHHCNQAAACTFILVICFLLVFLITKQFNLKIVLTWLLLVSLNIKVQFSLNNSTHSMHTLRIFNLLLRFQTY